MKTGFNTSLINSTNTDIYVVPALQRHLESNFNLSSINITFWNVTSYENSEMKIWMNFSDPFSISPLKE
jgi:hypothetical protein